MIPVHRPSIRRRDMDSVLTCMVNDSLGPGALAEQLVSAVCEYLGLLGGIALRERTRALELALLDLEPPAGSAVLLDPLVPGAYHEVVVSLGLDARYVEVADQSCCIDGQAAAAAAEGACAIVVEDRLGFVPDYERLGALGLPVIEDVSQAVGANAGDRRAGTLGRYVIVSLEADDIVTAGGGTLLLCPGKRERGSLRRRAERLPEDALLPDLNAALGLTQVREIEHYVARRAEIAGVYTRALMRGRHRALVQHGEAENVHYTFPVVVEGSVAEAVSYARKKGVATRPAFERSVIVRLGASATAEPGESDAGWVFPAATYPAARRLARRCLSFPLYPSLTAKEAGTVERVLSTLP